jgi:hypothetical protein
LCGGIKLRWYGEIGLVLQSGGYFAAFGVTS